MENAWWVVPKVNFPDGLPANMRHQQIDLDTLAQAEMVHGGIVDAHRFYITDQVVVRDQLGLGVRQIRTYIGTQTTCAQPRASASQLQAEAATDSQQQEAAPGQPQAAA